MCPFHGLRDESEKVVSFSVIVQFLLFFSRNDLDFAMISSSDPITFDSCRLLLLLSLLKYF